MGDVPDCRGCGGLSPGVQPPRTPGSCSSWCQWVPSPSQQDVPDCRGCGGHPPVPISPPSTGCAGWCQQIPAEPRANIRECGGCMPVPGTPPPSSQECGDLSATENKACSEDVQWASTGGKNDPHAVSWYADMKEITGVEYGQGSEADFQRLFFCAPPGGDHACGLPPCTCSKPPCNTCSAEAPSQPPQPPSTPASCSSWCQWVPSPTQQDVADCRGCGLGATPGTSSPAEPRANITDAAPEAGTPPTPDSDILFP